MTAQAPDYYRYHGKQYAIIAMTEKIEPDFESYGFVFRSPSTACRRGHVCEYSIRRGEIYLQNLYACCKDDEYPVFNGVAPIQSEWHSMMVYKDLNLFMNYTGKIVLGRGFINKYYIHMGFQQAWAYEEVIELVFENGVVVNTINHNETVSRIREEHDNDPEFREASCEDMIKYIKNCFSLDAKVKAWWI